MGVFLFLFAIPPAESRAAGPGTLDLTARERQWLIEHPVIRVAPDPDYQPIESIDANGNLVGISADILKLLEQKLRIRFEIVTVQSWDEAMRKARNREVDMLSAATKSAARSKFMRFTSPHIELPGVIIVRSDRKGPAALVDLPGRKLGVVSSYIWQEWIARDHPGIKLRAVGDVPTGLLLVSFGQLDAMIANLATATHHIAKLGVTNLRVAGESGYFARLAMATRKDWPELNIILQKALSSITPVERQTILKRWISLKSESTFGIWAILIVVLGAIGMAVGGNLLWTYSLRKRVRQQNNSLRESEERFRAIVEDQTECIGRSLPESHVLTFVNEAYCGYFGRSREELLGTSFMDHIPAEQRTEVARQLATLSRENSVVYVEHRVVTADGDVRWQAWTDRAIFDDRGNITEIQAVGRDITESKLADEALRESEERYRMLFEASLDALLVTDDDGIIVFTNAAALDVFGARSTGQLLGMHMLKLVHPDDHDSVLARRNHITPGNLPTFAERRRLRLDGTDFSSESRGVPFTWKGKPAVLIVVRDITERKQAEERFRQAHKMEAVGQLTSGVAHDFNNLLTVVLGNAEMLRDELGDSDNAALVDSVLRATKRGAELTQRLLAFARQQPLSPKIVDLDALVAGMIDLLRRSLGDAIEIETRETKGLWPVKADPGQLENALLNLAINARDAMPAGGRLTLETGMTIIGEDAVRIGISPGDYATLSVTDTGAGMPPDTLGHIFEPFFTTKDVGDGSGLGLSMVYGFAAQSGGGVEVESEEGQGTKVTLYLPRTTETHTETAATTRNADSLPRGNGETVLLVEDEPDVRDLTAAMLSGLGYRVIEAGNGKDGIAAFEETPGIDLVLTDLIMPGGMNGFEMVDRLRGSHAGVRALFISGYHEMALDRGRHTDDSTEILTKPFQRRQLARSVRTALDAPVLSIL